MIAAHLWPRLYCSHELTRGGVVVLSAAQIHYLHHVLRLESGGNVRVFNAAQGEWAGVFQMQGKKNAALVLDACLRLPVMSHEELHLFFSPLRKDRMDFLIEKSVELGVTHLHPVVFARSVVREVKRERLDAQIIEAAEQCERLDIPVLCDVTPLKGMFTGWEAGHKLFAALERSAAAQLFSQVVSAKTPVCGFLVGPEGGIAAEETEFLLSRSEVVPVSLGPRILRAETAALYGLSLLAF